MRRTRFLVAVALVAVTTSACSIDDWTSWGFNTRNTFDNTGGVQTDQVNTANAGSLKRLFTTTISPPGTGTSTIVTYTDTATKAQRAYFDANDKIYALNLQTHAIDWSAFENGGTGFDYLNDPAVSDDSVAFSNSQGGGEFSQWALATGAFLGGRDLPQSDSVHSTLTMNGGWIYVGAGYNQPFIKTGTVHKHWDDNPNGPPAGQTGWDAHDANASNPIATPVWTPPAVYNGVVYATSFDTLYAIRDTDGLILWSKFLGDAKQHLSAPTIAPTVNGHNLPTIYVTGDKVWALDLANGATRWSWGNATSLPTGVTAGATISNNQLLVGYDASGSAPNTLTSLDATTGAVQFTKHYTPPAGQASGSTIQPITANGVVYLSNPGAVWVIRAGDGGLLKLVAPASELTSRPTMSEGLLLLPTQGGVDAWGL